MPHIPPRDPNAPRYSKAPWAGFTPREHARETPRSRCDSLRCRRARQCLAAHDGLYCRRTHYSHKYFLAREKAEGRIDPPLPPLPKQPLPEEIQWRAEELQARVERKRHEARLMLARWKAGEFDAIYGKYSPRGMLMKPPPRNYVEEMK
jgi:hypothetical protein